MVDQSRFALRPIQADDDTGKLSLGLSAYTPLKIFLQKNAVDFHRYQLAKTYVLIDLEHLPTRVWGYITLMSSEILLKDGQRPTETAAASAYRGFPAIKIARLALDKRLQGQGYGAMILDWCFNHVKLAVMPHVGCRFMMVDAKQDSVGFYQKAGFVLLDADSIEDHPQMFYDLYKEEGGLVQETVDAIGF